MNIALVVTGFVLMLIGLACMVCFPTVYTQTAYIGNEPVTITMADLGVVNPYGLWVTLLGLGVFIIGGIKPQQKQTV